MPKYNCLIKFTQNAKLKLEKYRISIQKTARQFIDYFQKW
ncbi:hypothetical protein ES708_26324 [subsurface metagenome]